MRRRAFVLPALAMGLLYSSIYVGLIIINLRGSASGGRGDVSVLLHFALTALTASALSFAVGKGTARLRRSATRLPMFLSTFLALAALFLMVLPSLPGDMVERIFNAHPPILAMGTAFFMPVGLLLFFRTVPIGKAGFAFACVIACSELLWALLFPLIGWMSGGIASQPPDRQAFHLFSLCYWMIGCAGLCLAVSLVRTAREDAAVTPDAAIVDAKGPFDKAHGQKTYRALCLIFAAGVSVFCMMGLHMGMLMPKTAVLPELIGILHFMFLFLLPLAGRMLDENPGRLMRMSVLGLAAVFLLGLLHENGLIGRMPLFYTLNFMQSILLLTAYTATARLLRTHAVFPLLITLAHCLYITHSGGVALRGLAEAVPRGVAAASLLLALGAAFCLWRFHALLENQPTLWALPLTGNTAAPLPEAAAEPAALHPVLRTEPLAAFAAAYCLSKQEMRVMEMLAQNQPTKKIAEALAVEPNTVRTYIVRLMHKTDTHNRARLMERYAAHSSTMDIERPGAT